MVRALGLKPETGASSFSDVESADWYGGAIKTAVEYGLIKGYKDWTFRPMDKITRQEAIVIIARAMNIAGLNNKVNGTNITTALSSFSDQSKVAYWAKQAVASVVKDQLVQGDQGQIKPI